MLRQARHEHTDNDALARSLLQLAMRVSTHIHQSGMRPKALKELVRVATLFDGPHSPGEYPAATHAYTPLVGAGGPRRGKVVRRGSDTAARSSRRKRPTPRCAEAANTCGANRARMGVGTAARTGC